jgi:hypothetical protein
MFERYDPNKGFPYAVVAWDVDGCHCYGEAREAAKVLSSNGRYAIVHRMDEGIPEEIENIYRDGIEVAKRILMSERTSVRSEDQRH